MNRKLRNLEKELMKTLNSSDLPAEVKRILLGKLEAQMTLISNQDILIEPKEIKEDAKSV